MHIINKKTFIFYLFLCLLLISKLMALINMNNVWEPTEKQNLFIASSIAQGVPPLPSFFKVNEAIGGGGSLMVSTIAVPFILFFGKSYFSLRLASIVFLIIIYIITFKFCIRYLHFETAVCASLLFIITPDVITHYSLVGDGRHFHLNLFFITSLYFFSKIKEEGKTLYYLLFSVASGIGIYFYPAFLVTVFVMGLFLLSEINVKKPSSLFKYSVIIIGVIIACQFLESAHPWYRSIYNMLTDPSRKGISISGNVHLIFVRFISLLFYFIPNIFYSPILTSHHAPIIFMVFPKLLFSNISLLSKITLISLELFRFIFVISFLVLLWRNRISITKIMYNIFSLKCKQSIPLRGYITSFLLVHFILYAFLYGLNEQQIDWGRFFYPLFLNIILLVAFFITQIWHRNKIFSFCALLFVLSPGIVFQYHTAKTFSMEDFYKSYIFFYEARDTNELFLFKDKLTLKRMIDALPIKTLNTLGSHYSLEGYYWLYEDSVFNAFKYLSNGNMAKLKRLYQGYIQGVFVETEGNLHHALSTLKNIDEKYWEACYKGLGEGLIIYNFIHPTAKEFNAIRDKNSIASSNFFIQNAYKKYFFQGIGEGLAKQFAIPFSDYITKDGLYDEGILNDYVNIIDDTYKNDFLTGFFNNEIWSDF